MPYIHANELLDGKKGIAAQFGAIHYYESEEILNWCNNLKVSSVRGVRTFFDLQQNQEIQKDPEWQKKMFEMECRVSNLEEYKKIAFFHHIVYERYK